MAEAPKKTFTQDRAEREARRLLHDIRDYQNILPLNQELRGGVRVCRADGWNICCDYLDGDFDLDQPMADLLISTTLNAGPSSFAPTPVSALVRSPAQSTTWLEQYLFGDPQGKIGTSERVWSETKNTVAGPGNVAANFFGLKDAVNAAVEKGTANAIRDAARAVQSGAAGTVKINQYMTLYNANNKGGAPWPRLRVRGLPTQVVTPALGDGAKVGARGIRGGMTVADAMIKAERMGKVAAGTHWSGSLSILRSWKGGLFLSVGPSLALDIYSSYDRDLHGKSDFNWRKFTVATAKSQSGNLLGWGVGALTTIGAVAVIGVGAPAVLIGLAVGGVVQIAWGSAGGSDWASTTADRAWGK